MTYARVFQSGNSQAVRLPKEFRFDSEAVSIRRVGSAVILEPLDEWPLGYVASFAGASSDLERPAQGVQQDRESLG